MKWFVRIVEDATNKTIREFGPYTLERHADKVAAGASRNLDHDRFTVVTVSDEDGKGKEP